jgi:hypothetical protein
LADFLPIGLLLKAHYDFLKAQNNANLLNFYLNKQFQNLVGHGYFKVLKVV